MVPLTLMKQFPNHFLCQRGSLPSLHHLHIHCEKGINNQQVGYVGFPDIAIGPRSSRVAVGHKMPKLEEVLERNELDTGWTYRIGKKHHTARIRYVTCWYSIGIHHYIFYCTSVMHYYTADTFDHQYASPCPWRLVVHCLTFCPEKEPEPRTWKLRSWLPWGFWIVTIYELLIWSARFQNFLRFFEFYSVPPWNDSADVWICWERNSNLFDCPSWRLEYRRFWHSNDILPYTVQWCPWYLVILAASRKRDWGLHLIASSTLLRAIQQPDWKSSSSLIQFDSGPVGLDVFALFMFA